MLRFIQAFGGAAARGDVLADKLPQFLLVAHHVVDEHVALQGFAHEGVELTELLRAVVARRDVPVEVVLVEHLLDAVVRDEGHAGAVEGGKVLRRQETVEGAGLADGEDELHEAVEDVVRGAFLGLGPHEALGLVLEERFGDGHGHAEVDVADDAGGVVGIEEVLGDTVFQFLLADVGGIAAFHDAVGFFGRQSYGFSGRRMALGLEKSQEQPFPFKACYSEEHHIIDGKILFFIFLNNIYLTLFPIKYRQKNTLFPKFLCGKNTLFPKNRTSKNTLFPKRRLKSPYFEDA